MSAPLPQSVLFCCDHNAVRSPMAEGIMKKFYGTDTYVQSVGVENDLEINGFSIAVCAELEVELSRHRSRSFDEMEQWGDDLGSFDLVIALSPASHQRALELTKSFHLAVEYWPILDPTGMGEGREAKLEQFRAARDQIASRLIDRFGPPAKVSLPMSRDLITRYFDAFNAKDISAMLDCLSEDVAHHVNEGEVRRGKTPFAEFCAHMERCYDEELTDMVILSEPSGTRFAAEYMVNGTYLATDAGLPEARGQTYRLPAGSFFEVAEGRITRVTTYYSLSGWIAQVS